MNAIDDLAEGERLGDQAQGTLLLARARVREAEQAVAAYSWRAALEDVAETRLASAASRHEQEFASNLGTLIKGAGEGIRAATDSALEAIGAELQAVKDQTRQAAEVLEQEAETRGRQAADQVSERARNVMADAERAQRELEARIEASLERRFVAAADHFTQQFAQLARELEERLNAALTESAKRLADELSAQLDRRVEQIRSGNQDRS